MKKTAIALLSIVGLLSAAGVFLLATGTGLRWTVDQVLSRVDLPVEIGIVDGRLIGPLRLEKVTYRDEKTGAALRLDTLELDWRPGDLLKGLLHVTRVRVAGIEYTAGASDRSSQQPKTPVRIPALPLEVLVDRLEVDSLVAAGVRIDHASLRAALDAQAVTLEDISVESDQYRVNDGRIRLGLAPELPLEGAVTWVVETGDLPAFHGTLNADGEIDGTLRPRVALSKPFTATVDGTVTGLLATPSWTMTATVPEAVSLNRIVPAWPALSVRGALESEGDMAKARLRPDLSLAFQGQQVELTGNALVDKDGLTVDAATLQRADAPDTIELAGRVGWSEALPFSVHGDWRSLNGPEAAPWSSRSGEFEISGDLNDITAAVSGVVSPPDQEEESDIQLDLEASHLDRDPVVTGSLRVPYFHYGAITARELTAEVDFDAAAQRPSRVDIGASTVRFDERTVAGLALKARGSIAEHELTLKGRYEESWTVETRVAGGYSAPRWQGSVQQLRLAPVGDAPATWQAKAPADLSWSPKGMDLQRLCLGRNGAEVCAGGGFTADKGWGVDAEASGLPLKWLATGAPDALRIEGTVAAKARVGNPGDGITGEAEARITRATVEWTAEDPVTTRYENVALTATLDPSALQAKLNGTVEGSGKIDGELTTRDPLAEDGALDGRLSARLPSLRLVQAFVPVLGLQKGTAEMDLRVTGTRRAPEFDGEARIAEAVVDVEPLGIQLNGLNASVRGEPGGRLRLTAEARSGEGTLNAGGEFGRNADGAWQGEITLQGEQAELVSLPRAVIEGDPDLSVAIEPSGGRISGRIDFTHAVLTPDAGHSGVTISDDIVVMDGSSEQATTNPMAWHATVTIDLGPDTRFSGFGVKGQLTGALELDAPPYKPTRANGSIEIQDGSYTLYGRTFDIDRGRLVYAGGPVDNPGLELRIAREVGETNVSLAVSGPLVEPELTLSSSRAMSETDKMSYLLLGRPASQASGAEAGLLLRAATSFLPGGASDVPGYLRSTLGLDTVELQTGNGDTEGAAVELGKYLSPRLYVSYVAGIQESVDVFRVHYDLARHWLLRAESSTRESGGDLLFTW